MSYIENVVFEDGVTWAVGSHVFRNACILIPAEGLGDLSDEEIGMRVRHLIPYAYEVNRQEIASWDKPIKHERPEKPKKKSGYIYLACTETGHHKIGISVKPGERIKAFDTIMPVDVWLVHMFKADDTKTAEKKLHEEYADKRHSGEWFVLDEDDIGQISSIHHYKNGAFVR